MKKSNLKVAVGVAALMTALISLSACQKPADTAGASAPSLTVGTHIDDTVVSSNVSASLLADSDIKSSDIKVEVRKGEVLLTGFVDSQAQIDRAVSLVNTVDGVKAVNNKLMVKDSASSMGNKVDDTVITTKVKATLLADSAVKSFDIGVVTNKGEVELSGFVDNATQIARATELAEKTEGVHKVTNNMSIKK